MDALEHLLSAPIPSSPAIPTLTAWLERLEACPFERPIDRALWAGFEADRLGFAFIGGYRAALGRLFDLAGESLGQLAADVTPTPLPARISLAATESGGAHPKAIETTLIERDGVFLLNGEKTFATLASIAEELLVVASLGAGADGKNRLTIVRVRADAPGITITDRKPTPFAPEIPHSLVTLKDVAVKTSDVLPGDGYGIWLKPFRTIEDTYVFASTLGYVMKASRAYGFDNKVPEGALALIAGLRHVAKMAPLDPKAHIALAGLVEGARRLLSSFDAEWEKADADVRDRWRRDLGLLVVAEMVRGKRTEAAWKALRTQTLSQEKA